MEALADNMADTILAAIRFRAYGIRFQDHGEYSDQGDLTEVASKGCYIGISAKLWDVLAAKFAYTPEHALDRVLELDGGLIKLVRMHWEDKDTNTESVTRFTCLRADDI